MKVLIFMTILVFVLVIIAYSKTLKESKSFKMLFGKNSFTIEDRKQIAVTFKPVLDSINWLKPLAQFISGSTFAFFVASYVINNFTSLPLLYSITLSSIIGIVFGLLVEGGLSTFLTPFWQTLIAFRFNNRITLFLFLFVTFLVVGFGSITTIGSRYASPELVEMVSNDSISIDVQVVSNTMLSPIQALISNSESAVKSIEESRKQGRKSIENKWNAKIAADQNWAAKKNIKNYVSPHIAKKERELSYYDANTAKAIQDAAQENTSSIDKLTDNASKVLSSAADLQKAESQDKKQRKDNYSFIVMSIAIFATIATVLLVGIREMILFGAGKFITTGTPKEDILDDFRQDTTPNADNLDNSVNQEVVNYVTAYLNKHLKASKDTISISENAKGTISKWFVRGYSDKNSNNWKRFQEVKRQLAALDIEMTVSGTQIHFWYQKQRI